MLEHLQTIGERRTPARVTPGIRQILVLLVALHLALPLVGLSAEKDRAYSRGKKAADETQWASAVRLMMQAIDAEPDEKKRPLSSPYIPHFFLGLSLYELGDCDLAIQHLQKSRRYRVVQETKRLPKLAQIEKSCDNRSEVLRRVRGEIISANQLADRVEAKTADPLLNRFWNRGLPPPIVQFREAEFSLERAEQLLETRTTDIRVSSARVLQIRSLTDEQISSSSQMTSQVIDLLQNLDKAAEQDAEVAATARQTLLDEVLDLRLRAVRAWNSAAIPVSRSTGQRDLAREFEHVTNLYLGDGGVTLDELQDAKVQLAEFLDDLEELPPRRQLRRRAPTVLHKAAEAYFAGQYGEVLTVLEDVTFSERQAQAHLYLFRAAALYSLYLIGDEPDPDLLSAAQSNVQSCLRASASLVPLAEAFSPRFVQFFREQSSLEPTTTMVAGVPGSQ